MQLPAIYLVRHGQTIWNTLGRLQGLQNSPLTEYGRHQVDRMGQVLLRAFEGKETPLQCHVSPLERAQVTASRLLANMPQMQVRTDARLAEVDFGSWEGMTAYEIDKEYPGALDGVGPFDWFFRSPDGESFQTASARVGDWLESITEPTIAVTHGVTARAIIGVCLGLPQEQALRLTLPDGGVTYLTDGMVSFLS